MQLGRAVVDMGTTLSLGRGCRRHPLAGEGPVEEEVDRGEEPLHHGQGGVRQREEPRGRHGLGPPGGRTAKADHKGEFIAIKKNKRVKKMH